MMTQYYTRSARPFNKVKAVELMLHEHGIPMAEHTVKAYLDNSDNFTWENYVVCVAACREVGGEHVGFTLTILEPNTVSDGVH